MVMANGKMGRPRWHGVLVTAVRGEEGVHGCVLGDGGLAVDLGEGGEDMIG